MSSRLEASPPSTYIPIASGTASGSVSFGPVHARISRVTKRSDDESRAALAALNANGRLITADEVANSILNLCHPLSGSINGASVTIDGGTSA